MAIGNTESFIVYINISSGNPFDRNKLCLVLVASLGFYLFLSSKSGEEESHNPAGDFSVLTQFAVFTEKPLSDSTVMIGMVMALINLLLDVPIMFLTKWCAGTSAPVQSFWSGVGGFLVGILTSFFNSKTSIFSGHYSAYEFCTDDPYGNLTIDFNPKDPKYKYRKNLNEILTFIDYSCDCEFD